MGLRFAKANAAAVNRLFWAGLVLCVPCIVCWSRPALSPGQGTSDTTSRLKPLQLPDPPPQNPAESARMLHVREGYQAELVVAEPLVQDPVAVDWGLDGSLWVAEMADYPEGIDGQGRPGGRVRVVRDTDGDGRYDQSTVFLDGLSFPNGIMTWRHGVLITAAPEIIFAADTDGDDRADQRQSLYTGFLEGNQQLRVNGLRWGLDNWVYCASGSHYGGYGADRRVTSVVQDQTLVLGSRDFRMRPDSGAIEPESGPSQYGRNQNDWGDWFGVQNSFPLWHYVLADRYIRRNAYYAPADPRKQLVLPANPPVYPAKAPQKRFHGFDMAGHFTSACSGMIYRDQLLFGGDTSEHGFTCEPFHNLVQHHVVERAGVSYDARRDPGEPEFDFFASKDRWCRPVMVRTGPEGALWVVDMYRYMIEHPEWLPPEGQEELRPYYRSGETRGRIYRIVPTGRTVESWARTAPLRAVKSHPEMERPDESADALMDLLQSSNGWVRDKVHQWAVWNAPLPDPVVARIRRFVTSRDDTEASAVTRLQALCLLDGTGQLDQATLTAALSDAHWAVRRQAIRLAEQYQGSFANIEQLLPGLTTDPDMSVRLQLACSLGELRPTVAGPALARLAVDAKDPFLRDAIMSSLRDDTLESFVAALARSEGGLGPWVGPLSRLAAAHNDPATLEVLLRALLAAPQPDALQAWQWSGLAALADAWEQAGRPFDRWSAHTSPHTVAWEQALGTSRARIMSTDAPQSHFIRLLDRQPDQHASDRRLLADLLSARMPLDVQLAVIAHLARRPSSDLPELLLARWAEHSPNIRTAIVDALLQRPNWTISLLQSCQDQAIAAGEIPLVQRQAMAQSKNEQVRALASVLFKQSRLGEREQLVRLYRDAIETPGDARMGQTLFQKHCATCHQLGEIGHNVGPNLQALTDRSTDSFLASILDPNRAVEPKYLSYTFELRDGTLQSGLIDVETATSVTLRTPDGKEMVVLRADLEQVQATGKSLMPEGLEQELSVRQMADLLAFLVTATQGEEDDAKP